MPTPIQPPKTQDISQYRERMDSLREAVGSGDASKVQSAANDLQTFIDSKKDTIDVGGLPQAEDLITLRAAEKHQVFLGLPDAYREGLQQFITDRVEDRPTHAGPISNSAERAKLLHGQFTAPEADARANVMAAGANVSDAPDAQLFFSVLGHSDAQSVEALMGPFVTDPKQMEELKTIANSQGDLKSKLEGFNENRAVQDAMTVLLGGRRRPSKAFREQLDAYAATLHGVSAEELKPKMKRQARDQVREALVGVLHGARQQIFSTAHDAVAGDVDPTATLDPKDRAQAQAARDAAADVVKQIQDDPSKVTKEQVAAAVGGTDKNDAQLSPMLSGPKWDMLKETNPQVASSVADLHSSRQAYQTKARSTVNEIMSLVDSGLPIELIVMLVMTKLTEKEEESLKLKMKEAGAIDAFQSHNDKVADVKGARSRVVELMQAKKDGEGAVQALKNDPNLAASDKMQLQKLVNRIPPDDKIRQVQELASTNISTISPADFGVSNKSTTVFMQELQVHQQQYMQIMQALTAIIRQVQDMISTVVRNIR